MSEKICDKCGNPWDGDVHVCGKLESEPDIIPEVEAQVKFFEDPFAEKDKMIDRLRHEIGQVNQIADRIMSAEDKCIAELEAQLEQKDKIIKFQEEAAGNGLKQLAEAQAEIKNHAEWAKKFAADPKNGAIMKLTRELAKAQKRIAELEAALEFYADESINNHNYHADMNTDLTKRARKALEG